MSDKSKIWNSLRVYSAELKPVESFTYDEKDLRYTGLFLLHVFFFPSTLANGFAPP